MKVPIVKEPTFVAIAFAIVGIVVDLDQITIAVRWIAIAILQIIVVAIANNIGFVDFNH